MATGRKSTPKQPKGRQPKEPPQTAILASAMRLAAVQGWRDTTLADIADEAGVGLDVVREHCPSKPSVLALLSQVTDLKVLAGSDPEMAREPVRDRLFDVLMRRLEALAPYREGIRAVSREMCRDPEAALCHAAGPMRRSLEWMLEAARLPHWGPLRPLQVKGLGVVYLAALRTWLRDDSEDLAKTMAVLDRNLQRLDRLASALPFTPRRRGAGSAEGATG